MPQCPSRLAHTSLECNIRDVEAILLTATQVFSKFSEFRKLTAKQEIQKLLGFVRAGQI